MPSFKEVKSIIEKLSSIEELRGHICFFGGSIPYIFHGEESGREHSDVDILVDSDYIGYVRAALKSSNMYNPKHDSLNLDLDMDYGLKAFLNGVYVEFEPMSYRDGVFTRASFSPEKELAGIQVIPCEKIEDIIVPITVGGNRTLSQSMEMIMAEKEIYKKEEYRREKDEKDIQFIKEHGIDEAKYQRVQEAIKRSKTEIHTYDEIRSSKKGQSL